MTTTTEERRSTKRGIPADSFGNRLMLTRAHAGHLSIREASDLCSEAAAAAGVRLGRGAWANWEKGAKPDDLLTVVEIVSEQFGVDPDWLLNGGALAGERRRRLRWGASRLSDGQTTVALAGRLARLGSRQSRPANRPEKSTRTSDTRRPVRLRPPSVHVA